MFGDLNPRQLGAARLFETPAYLDPLRGVYFCEDFVRGIGGVSSNSGTSFDETAGGVTYQFNGGTRVSAAVVGSAGAVDLTTGTNANGGARMFLSGGLRYRVGGGRIRMRALVEVPVLPSAAQNFAVTFGLLDVISGAPVNRVTVDITDGVNSGRWYLRSFTGGVETTYNSDVAPSANQRMLVELQIDETGSTATLLINSVEAISGAINIPTPVALGIQCNKAVGTTARTCRVHFVDFLQIYSVPLL